MRSSPVRSAQDEGGGVTGVVRGQAGHGLLSGLEAAAGELGRGSGRQDHAHGHPGARQFLAGDGGDHVHRRLRRGVGPGAGDHHRCGA